MSNASLAELLREPKSTTNILIFKDWIQALIAGCTNQTSSTVNVPWVCSGEYPYPFYIIDEKQFLACTSNMDKAERDALRKIIDAGMDILNYEKLSGTIFERFFLPPLVIVAFVGAIVATIFIGAAIGGASPLIGLIPFIFVAIYLVVYTLGISGIFWPFMAIRTFRHTKSRTNLDNKLHDACLNFARLKKIELQLATTSPPSTASRATKLTQPSGTPHPALHEKKGFIGFVLPEEVCEYKDVILEVKNYARFVQQAIPTKNSGLEQKIQNVIKELTSLGSSLATKTQGNATVTHIAAVHQCLNAITGIAEQVQDLKYLQLGDIPSESNVKGALKFADQNYTHSLEIASKFYAVIDRMKTALGLAPTADAILASLLKRKSSLTEKLEILRR